MNDEKMNEISKNIKNDWRSRVSATPTTSKMSEFISPSEVKRILDEDAQLRMMEDHSLEQSGLPRF